MFYVSYVLVFMSRKNSQFLVNFPGVEPHSDQMDVCDQEEDVRNGWKSADAAKHNQNILKPTKTDV